jgi:hypothetical protein
MPTSVSWNITTAPTASSGGSGTGFIAYYSLTDASTVTPDWNNGNVQAWTIGGNRSLAQILHPPSGTGQPFVLIVTQNASGGNEIIWDGSYNTGLQPNLAPGSVTVFTFFYIGSGNWAQGYSQLFNPGGSTFTSPDAYQTFTLSSGQLLTLHTAPVMLLSAPGAGFVYQVTGAELSYEYGTSAYTVPTGVLSVVYGASGASLQIGASSGFLDQAFNMIQFCTAPSAYLGASFFENKALYLSCSGGDPSGGNGGLIVNLSFRIHAVGF